MGHVCLSMTHVKRADIAQLRVCQVPRLLCGAGFPLDTLLQVVHPLQQGWAIFPFRAEQSSNEASIVQ